MRRASITLLSNTVITAVYDHLNLNEIKLSENLGSPVSLAPFQVMPGLV
jgi:hypothetical protein